MAVTQATRKTLEAHATPPRADTRWLGKDVLIFGECFVLVEAESYRIFPSKIVNGKKVSTPIKVEWYRVHMLHSKHLQARTFRCYKHQGRWLWSDSSDHGFETAIRNAQRPDHAEIVRRIALYTLVDTITVAKKLADWIPVTEG